MILRRRSDLTQAIAIDPNAVPAYVERGFAYIDLEDLGAAQADMDFALALDPLSGGAYMGRALIALNQLDYTRAEAEYTHAIELGSINPIDALFGRAFARMQLGDYPGALDDYNIVIAFDPGNINVRVNRIETYMMMANFQTVIRECDDIVSLNTGYTAYCFMHLAREANAQAILRGWSSARRIMRVCCANMDFSMKPLC